MNTYLRCSLIPAILISLSGCSGSSSSDETPANSVESYQSVINSPADHTAAELDSAYDSKISNNYKGNTDTANMSAANTQLFFNKGFGKDRIWFWGISRSDMIFWLEDGATRTQLDCDSSGVMNISGNYVPGSVSTITIQYENCSYYGSQNINGTEVVKLISFQDSPTSIEYKSFLNSISFVYGDEDKQYTITGRNHVYMDVDTTTEQSLIKLNSNFLYKEEGSQHQFVKETKYEYVYDFSNDSETVVESGSLKDSEVGAVLYKRDGAFEYGNVDEEHTYTFIGDVTTQLDLKNYEYIKFLLDSDNDGSFEEAAYIGSYYQFEYADLTNLILAPVDQLSLPPIVYAPYVNTYDITTKTPIEVSPGSYYDSDTDQEDLTVSYRWYLNDSVIEDQVSNILPPYIAVFDDKLEVAMVVTDGSNYTESTRRLIIINDSPGEIQISDLPEVVNAGDSVSFTAQVIDPDLRSDESTTVKATLVSGPDNASMDDNGLVTWQSPINQLFPKQEYIFNFANPSNEAELFTTTIAIKSDTNMPMSRSGMEVPSSNYSMWVGDFTGDGNNEILSTDSQNRVFLISESEGTYSQSWLYPFTLDDNAKINQVIGLNTDSDSQLEILVITDKGISLIGDLNKAATTLLQDADIRFAAVADSNNDGDLEIAYLKAESTYSSGSEVKVINFDNPTEVLFETTVGDSSEIVFANVDADSALELVINNGRVYDGKTWANQWISGTKFGSSYVTAGDFNGDGIDEIAGADSWDHITLFSAVTKEQLYTLETFNTCVIYSANIDDDAADELIVGDCQWGNISAYDYQDGALSKAWELDMQGHGSKSLSVGDSDNDGKLEIHWGTGQSSSGEDGFVVADIIGANPEIKERATAVQLDNFSSVGWTQNNTSDEAVFIVPSTQSGYGGSRLATVSKEGEVTVTEELGSNWDGSSFAALTDFNNDGEDDVFVPTTNTYNGSFAALQLSDLSVHWEIDGDYDDNIGVILAYDLNDDSFDDAIYVNSQTVNAIDISNQVILGTHKVDSTANDIAIANSAGSMVLAIASNKLTIVKSQANGFVELDFVEQYCSRIEFANLDTDAQLELVCLASGSYWDSSDTALIVYDITNEKLVELKTLPVPIYSFDFAIDTTNGMEQGVFVAVSPEGGFPNSKSVKLLKINADGKAIWSSPAMIGRVSKRGIKFRHNEDGSSNLILSTNSAMHILKDQP